MAAQTDLASRLEDQVVNWSQAKEVSSSRTTNTAPTEQALDRAELLWGKTDLSVKFRALLEKRGLSIYDRTIEHHFTGCAGFLWMSSNNS